MSKSLFLILTHPVVIGHLSILLADYVVPLPVPLNLLHPGPQDRRDLGLVVGGAILESAWLECDKRRGSVEDGLMDDIWKLLGDVW